MSAKQFNACSVCAHEIHDAKCKHPWEQPFEEWPKALIQELRDLIFE